MKVISAALLGHSFRFDAAPGLFSADRVDDGTKLLLSHLPDREPKSVLDVGCGYGALGLPVAWRFPNAACDGIDRDLLAVACAEKNAEKNSLSNVRAYGSLGYRDVRERHYDWIVCNVPARIGDRAVRGFISGGVQRLTPSGELALVVIHALEGSVRDTARELGLPPRREICGKRHSVFAFGHTEIEAASEDELYARDKVQVGGHMLWRPHDIDEAPEHLEFGVPLVLDFLPKTMAGATALVRPCSYGALAIASAARGLDVLAVDRDLLATDFTGRNALAANLQIEVEASVGIPRDRRFDIVISEIVPENGPESARLDVVAANRSLNPGGRALWLARTKHLKTWLSDLRLSRLAERGPYTLLQDRK